MKIAFLTHTTGYGGAAISMSTALRYAIENQYLREQDCVVVIPTGTDYGAYRWFAGKVPFTDCIMPFSSVYKGASLRWRSQAYSIAKETMSITRFLTTYNRALLREGFTHIHLNSLVFWSLLPFLPDDIIKIIHIREMVRDTTAGRLAIKTINEYADGIIAISEQCAAPFPDATLVENPFNMLKARQLRADREYLKKSFGIPEHSFVISDFSTIGPQKGSYQLISLLEEYPPESGVVVMAVGAVDSNGHDILAELNTYPNFHYFIQNTDMNPFYAMSDVVIRCEDYLPLGRTVYEGIYAGCISVVPYAPDDSTKEISQYIGKQIILYPAGSASSLITRINTIRREYPNGVTDNGFTPANNIAVSSMKLVNAIKKVKFRRRTIRQSTEDRHPAEP